VSLGTAVDELCTILHDATTAHAVGGRTHWDVGGVPQPAATEVRAPSGIVAYDPRDLTVTVAAGTTVRELAAALAGHGQECVLDPRDVDATVGGLLATGLSGHRRLRWGPLRDRVLEVRFVTADGRVVKGGGPTVKNVTGFDLPRLLVGSMGTIGVLVQVILRCQPLPAASEWCITALEPADVRRRAYRPSCITWDGTSTHVLFEGVSGDLRAEQTAVEAAPVDRAPEWPQGPHRGRASVMPGRVRDLARALDHTGVRWLAEVGVGTVHVAGDDEAALAGARAAAEACGGWLLREQGAPGLDGFGTGVPNQAILARVRDAFDPGRTLGRGRWGALVPDPAPAEERVGG
jgi:glycolate oxidase FAD binding subunit